MQNDIKKIFLFISTSLIVNVLQAQRTHLNIDNDWKFYLGHAADVKKDFNYGTTPLFLKAGQGMAKNTTCIAAEFDDADWQKVDLPHDWVVDLPFIKSEDYLLEAHGFKAVGGFYPENSIGWYRKFLTLNPLDSGCHYSLQFDGIFRDSKVWLNGHYLGGIFSGYNGFSLDITDYLNFHAPNILVIRADATQSEGWFYEGAGIYRHVFLNKYNNTHFEKEKTFVNTQLQGENANVSCSFLLKNEQNTSAKTQIFTYILNSKGEKVSNTKKIANNLKINELQTVKIDLKLAKPILWSLENPYQYSVVSILKNGDKTIDSFQTKFGVRTIRFDAEKGFFLNEKNIKINGVCNHQDHAGVGNAVPDALNVYRLRLLKEMGVNAFRASHNPPSPELLDACDSLGILVLDETRLMGSSAETMSQFENLLYRDRNHPSIFLWSIGNEEGWIHTTDVGKRIAETMLRKQQEIDPSRTATYAADVGNVFEGINSVIPIRSFNYRHQFVDDYHRDHPNQPILGTEMGSTVTTRGIAEVDSVRAYVPDNDITAPWWSSTAEQWWSKSATRPYWAGSFIWTGFDYRGEPTPYHYPNINSHFGVMDVCGFPKNIYYYYQSWWTQKDVLHLSGHWNHEGKEGKSINVWCNSNADNVTLFLNGKNLGQKIMPRNGHLEWNVPYEKGVLSAVGVKNRRSFSTKIETTEAAFRIVLTTDKKTLLPDGKDVVVVNASVVDKQGREVQFADNLIQLSLEGGAKIIGCGNGDPSSHEPDHCKNDAWQRHLFSGKCQFIIQSTTKTSKIIVKAKSEGLENAMENIN